MSPFEVLARMWRYALTRILRSQARRVLVLGDSHVRVFEHPWFLFRLPFVEFDIEYVPGATAIGIVNLDSASTALARFTKALAHRPHDWVFLNLGEVDTAYSLWRLVDFRGVSIGVLFDDAIRNYCNFIAKIVANHRVAVLSAPLPTLSDPAGPQDETAAVRQQVTATRRERTDLAMAFNERIAIFCREIGVPFLDSSEFALGGDRFVKASWCTRGRYDHHYARFPYARCLARQINDLFNDRDRIVQSRSGPFDRNADADGVN